MREKDDFAFSAQRRRFTLQGQVQGVGFRPFVYALAREQGLSGFVRNSSEGVVVEVQGPAKALTAFARDLDMRLPPLAKVAARKMEALEALPEEGTFTIVSSEDAGSGHAVLISPDMALCADCMADMSDPVNRRYLYPFTNCTNCGPRYTITRSIPYDRAFTSMACFLMCPDCRAEYENPTDRRFHAQPNSCPLCGPKVWFVSKEELEAKARPFERGSTKPAYAAISSKSGNIPHSPQIESLGGEGIGGLGGGEETLFKGFLSPPQFFAALSHTASLLRGGGIAAIKGLGGFHLACDALNEAAVSRLRRLKERPHKPFALMVRDLKTAGRLAYLGEKEAALLQSPEHPVVLCRGKEGSPVAPACSPDTAMLGLMLPYTPLHEALFAVLAKGGEETRGAVLVRSPERELPGAKRSLPAGRGSEGEHIVALVMTSGNPGGEPICLGNREAIAGLGHMADGYLLHDRDILIRVDDSVVCPMEDQTLFYRRARGYVPGPVPLGPLFSLDTAGGSTAGRATEGSPALHRAEPAGHEAEEPGDKERKERLSEAFRALSDLLPDSASLPVILGVGAELKNTFCLTKKSDAFVSQHIGDMGNLETVTFHGRMIDHLSVLLQVRPDVVVRDLHPDFLSSIYAQETGLPVLALQHHYAHAHAVLAEHQYLAEEGYPPALVLALDGTGLGEDGSLWGGELLLVDALGKGDKGQATHGDGKAAASGRVHARLGHIAPMFLPGGDAAVREPWRIAHALLDRLDLLESTSRLLPWMPEYESAARLVRTMIARRLNSPESTSCGRLFDAVAALLGLCNATSYEGQAAIRLEEAQWGDPVGNTHGYDEVYSNSRLSAINTIDNAKNTPSQPSGVFAQLTTDKDAVYLCPVLAPGSGQDCWQLDTHSLFRDLWKDWQADTPVPVLARRFHASLALGLAELAATVASVHGLRHVGLSGGCMQNKTLVVLLSRRLRQKGLVPLLHTQLPPNDACISLGQAAWGLLTALRTD